MASVLLPSEPFQFLSPSAFRDDDLTVTLGSTHFPNGSGIEVPTYCFMLFARGVTSSIGHVHLRIGNTENLRLYQGHVGYGVDSCWRGRHYAERATRLILPIAKEHGINPIWVTCDPGNVPSRRTCERLGGIFTEIVDVPSTALAYRFGARRKCRFRLDL